MSDSASVKGTVFPVSNEKQIDSVDIVFKNIQYSIFTKKGEKKILKGLDGICKSG